MSFNPLKTFRSAVALFIYQLTVGLKQQLQHPKEMTATARQTEDGLERSDRGGGKRRVLAVAQRDDKVRGKERILGPGVRGGQRVLHLLYLFIYLIGFCRSSYLGMPYRYYFQNKLGQKSSTWHVSGTIHILFSCNFKLNFLPLCPQVFNTLKCHCMIGWRRVSMFQKYKSQDEIF